MAAVVINARHKCHWPINTVTTTRAVMSGIMTASSFLACNSNARFYELGLTRDSRVIPGLTVVSVLSTSNLGLNWD